MNKSKKLIALALALTLIIALIVILPACKKNAGSSDEVVVVTDKNGVPVTDENGEAITVVLETEIVEVTNANGDKVYDENGKVKTSVIYHSKNVEIPLTDKNGNPVTDANGKIVSTMITVPPKVERVITEVQVTDRNGNFVTDENGEILTYTLNYTTGIAGQGGNNSNWGTTLGGSQNDSYKAVAATPDGGCVALFQSNSKDGTVEKLVSDDASVPYIVVIKYDDSGKLKWQKVLSGDGSLSLNSVDVDSDGNIYAAGYTNAMNLGFQNYGDYDAVLYKLSSSGDVRWVKNFGGRMTDGFNGVAVGTDGSIVAAGLSASTDGNASVLGLSAGTTAAAVVKFNSNGDIVFAKAIGSTGDSFNDVDVDPSGNIYAVGNFSSGKGIENYGKADAVIAKFNSSGNLEWTQHYGGSKIDNFSGINAVGDGCVVVGRSQSSDQSLATLGNQGDYDAIIVKYNPNGTIVWENAFRGFYADGFNDITTAKDGTIVVCGYSASGSRDLKTIGNKGGTDGVIVTFNAMGKVSSVQGYGGSRDDKFDCICVLNSGEFVACGSTLSIDGDLVGARAPSDGQHTVGMIARFK
ncbi:MAG: SBBP repeat-containing protein [Clostridia bacterium]|nr:SBBP repeat-containing protein [Clostridia bacterium]